MAEQVRKKSGSHGNAGFGKLPDENALKYA
jgi:hypothetical protein